MFKVVVTDHGFTDFRLERAILETAGADLIVCQSATETEVVRAACDADAILTSHFPYTDRIIGQLKKCRLIVRYGVGFDTIDVAAATRKGIMVANVPQYCVDEVSDHAVALVLALNRLLLPYHLMVQEAQSLRVGGMRSIRALRGSIAGIIGLGRIGKLTARKLSAFGVDIIFHDPQLVSDYRDSGLVARKRTFEELLRQSHIIILHAPYTGDTFHMIDSGAFARMANRPCLVNVARGELLDNRALCEALQEKQISGAGLDVLDVSADSPVLSKLTAHENVILTPHSAWYSDQALIRLKTTAAEEVARVLRGEKPMALVNREVLTGRG